MEFKKFRTLGEHFSISATTGHSTIITNEFKSIPDVLWPQAYMGGAISEEMDVVHKDSYLLEKKREYELLATEENSFIIEHLKEIWENPIDYLDSKNNLILKKVIAKIGKPVKKEVIDSLWKEVSSSSEE